MKTPPVSKAYPHLLCPLLVEVLIEERLARGYSRYELALRANLARQTIGDIEEREYLPTINTLAHLCDAFPLPFSFLALRAEVRHNGLMVFPGAVLSSRAIVPSSRSSKWAVAMGWRRRPPPAAAWFPARAGR